MIKRSCKTCLLCLFAVVLLHAAVTLEADAAQAGDVTMIYYKPARGGFLIDFLAVNGLKYGFAYVGDSMNYDVFAGQGGETKIRPVLGDVVQNRRWRRLNSELWGNNVNINDLMSMQPPGYSITALFIYIWSDRERPDSQFWGSSDDGLKVVLNDEVLWRNQIQRSPSVDSDRMKAPLKKGWNHLLCIVDRVGGGHLFVGRFVDGEGKPIEDIKLVLIRPEDESVQPKFVLAETYNAEAANLVRKGHELRAAGRLQEAAQTYGRLLLEYPHADDTPRALSAKAETQFEEGNASLEDPAAAAETLRTLRQHYPSHPITEYGVMRQAAIEAGALNLPERALQTYRGFISDYPGSALVPAALLETGKLLLERDREQAIATLRRIITEHIGAEQRVEAFMYIGDARLAAGDTDAARRQYQTALNLSEEWLKGRFATDVGKQAWLNTLVEQLENRIAAANR